MDHLPLYRQLQRFKRENIPIALSTLEGWTKQSLDILDILYQHLLEDTRAKGYLLSDETPIKVIERTRKAPPIRVITGCTIAPWTKPFCSIISPAAAPWLQNTFYPGSGDTCKQMDRESMTRLENGRGLPILTGPMPGGNFDKARDNDRFRAEKALNYIQKLYAVEVEAREKSLSPEERKELRLKKSLEVLNEFGKWMVNELKDHHILPKSQMGKAFRYNLDSWVQLSALSTRWYT